MGEVDYVTACLGELAFVGLPLGGALPVCAYEDDVGVETSDGCEFVHVFLQDDLVYVAYGLNDGDAV